MKVPLVQNKYFRSVLECILDRFRNRSNIHWCNMSKTYLISSETTDLISFTEKKKKHFWKWPCERAKEKRATKDHQQTTTDQHQWTTKWTTMENTAPRPQTWLRDFTKHHGDQRHTFGKATTSQICFICKGDGKSPSIEKENYKESFLHKQKP